MPSLTVIWANGRQEIRSGRTYRDFKRAMYSSDARLGKIKTLALYEDGELRHRWEEGKGLTFPNADELLKGVKP